jgi:hypothetical protein
LAVTAGELNAGAGVGRLERTWLEITMTDEIVTKETA